MKNYLLIKTTWSFVSNTENLSLSPIGNLRASSNNFKFLAMVLSSGDLFEVVLIWMDKQAYQWHLPGTWNTTRSLWVLLWQLVSRETLSQTSSLTCYQATAMKSAVNIKLCQTISIRNDNNSYQTTDYLNLLCSINHVYSSYSELFRTQFCISRFIAYYVWKRKYFIDLNKGLLSTLDPDVSARGHQVNLWSDNF